MIIARILVQVCDDLLVIVPDDWQRLPWTITSPNYGLFFFQLAARTLSPWVSLLVIPPHTLQLSVISLPCEKNKPKPALPPVKLYLSSSISLSAFAHIYGSSVLARDHTSTSRYLFARDLAFFSVDFYSGDRASDLGRVNTKEILSLPAKEGLLFRHTFGKTLRGSDVHAFAVRRCADLVVCPVNNLFLYVHLSDAMGINLRTGYL